MDDYVVEHYADFGSGEPWVARTILQSGTLVNAVPAFGETRQEFHNEMGEVFETLGMAFNSLREIRRAVGDGAPALDLAEAYARLYGFLWTAYKDRFQKALRALGYDFGFVWQDDRRFEAGASALLAKRPEFRELVDLVRRYRDDFQNALAYYRNEYLVHREMDADPRMLASFHNLDAAEDTFDRVWRAVEAIIAGVVVVELPPQFTLVEIPEEERDPDRPERFGFRVAFDD
jgi:hypothetical protein